MHTVHTYKDTIYIYDTYILNMANINIIDTIDIFT